MAVKKVSRKRSTKKTTTKGLVKKVNYLMKKEKEEVDNWKYVYYQTQVMTSNLSSTTPHIRLLNGLIRGNDEVNHRIGDKCKFHRLTMNLTIVNSAALAYPEQFVRVLIIREKTALGSAIGLSQYFNASFPEVYDLRNIDTRNDKRFVTYYDKMYRLGNRTTSTASTLHINSGSPQLSIRINKKMSFETNYARANTGAIDDIDTNSLYLVIITSNPTSNIITVNGTFKFKFNN